MRQKILCHHATVVLASQKGDPKRGGESWMMMNFPCWHFFQFLFVRLGIFSARQSAAQQSITRYFPSLRMENNQISMRHGGGGRGGKKANKTESDFYCWSLHLSSLPFWHPFFGFSAFCRARLITPTTLLARNS
jgi:hypothetical protein